MNYKMVQREAETLGKDLLEFSSRVPARTDEPKKEGEIQMPVQVLALPDLTDELQCIHTRLTALLRYAENNRKS